MASDGARQQETQHQHAAQARRSARGNPRDDVPPDKDIPADHRCEYYLEGDELDQHPSVVSIAPHAAIDVTGWEVSFDDDEASAWAKRKVEENETFIKRLNGLAQPGTAVVPFSRHW